MKTALPLIFSLLAALGNALFAAAQKKAVAASNPFSALVASAVVCVILAAATVPVFGKANYSSLLRKEVLWVVAGGIGLYLTYLGFNLLYTRCGASYYVLYAVFSMVATVLVVGALVFRESLNAYQWAAVVSALFTVVLFSMGQK
jgi:drug/metabolite transporter (DMT)-like permease